MGRPCKPAPPGLNRQVEHVRSRPRAEGSKYRSRQQALDGGVHLVRRDADEEKLLYGLDWLGQDNNLDRLYALIRH